MHCAYQLAYVQVHTYVHTCTDRAWHFPLTGSKQVQCGCVLLADAYPCITGAQGDFQHASVAKVCWSQYTASLQCEHSRYSSRGRNTASHFSIGRKIAAGLHRHCDNIAILSTPQYCLYFLGEVCSVARRRSCSHSRADRRDNSCIHSQIFGLSYKYLQHRIMLFMC